MKSANWREVVLENVRPKEILEVRWHEYSCQDTNIANNWILTARAHHTLIQSPSTAQGWGEGNFPTQLP